MGNLLKNLNKLYAKITFSLLVGFVIVNVSCTKYMEYVEEIKDPDENTDPVSSADDFMIAVIGDTQYYTEDEGRNGQHIQHFRDKIDWITNNRVDSNIVYVISVGDIANNYDHSDAVTQDQWIKASNVYASLENISDLTDGLPYGVIAGNHDVGYNSPWGISPFYVQYFGHSRYSNRSYYQGEFPIGVGTNENHYDFVDAGPIKLMIVYLRWQPNPVSAEAAYNWAYQRMAENPDRKAIVVTHYSVHGSRDSDLDGKLDWGLQNETYSQAAHIYDRLKELPNFFMTIGGHVSGEGRRNDTYNGSLVKSLTVNYQGQAYPPGLLRVMKFSSQKDRIHFMTFIPGQPHMSSPKSTFYLPWEHTFTTSRIHDFDNDGSSQPAFFKDGIWHIHGMPPVAYGNRPTDIPVPGDYDGDGKTEIAIFREGATYNRWLRQDSDDVVFGQPGDIPAPGDYDGNGTTDYAFFRPSEGRWYVRHDYLPSPRYTTQLYGQDGDIPVPADYNGDGKVDYALFRPSTGEWFRFNIHRGQYGFPGDIPVPGDYNGDGIAERAVYRPSNNGWYIWGTPQPVIIGMPGDIPVPGDYDGDGKTDMAVYRLSDGNVYVNDGTVITTGELHSYPVNLPYAIRHFFFP